MTRAVAISSVLGLDVGGKRVGVAVASLNARLPRPLATLIYDEDFFDNLQALIEAETVTQLVVGWPRGLEGQHTGQTEIAETFVKELEQHIALPVQLQDEALTSNKATAELEARGKPYRREEVDALAATYILQDWLSGNAVE